MNSIVDEFEMEIGLVTSEESSLLPHLSNPSHDPCHPILFAEFAVGYDYMLPGWHYLCIDEASKSSKAIEKHVIINFSNKNWCLEG